MGRATRRPPRDTTNNPTTSSSAKDNDNITTTSPGDNLNLITRVCTPDGHHNHSDGGGGTKQSYLETSSIIGCVTGSSDYKLREIVDKPEGVDYNEWIASHTISFFDHINMMYGCISEFCTMSGCPEMAGPGNRQYLWIDEKGKRIKFPAPQYIDYALTFIQKTVNDENIFPTKFDKEFPATFENHVKKMIKLMLNILGHMYNGHFKEIVQLNLHSHLNCLFSHLILFNDTFKLIGPSTGTSSSSLTSSLTLSSNIITSNNSSNYSANELADLKELESLIDDVYNINMLHFDIQPAVTTPSSTSVNVSSVSTTKDDDSTKQTKKQVSSVSSPSPTTDGSHIIPTKKSFKCHNQDDDDNVDTSMEVSSGQVTPSPSPSAAIIKQQPGSMAVVTPPPTPAPVGQRSPNRMEID